MTQVHASNSDGCVIAGQHRELGSVAASIQLEGFSIESKNGVEVDGVGDDDECRIGVVHGQHSITAHETHGLFMPSVLDRDDGNARREEELEGEGRTAGSSDEVRRLRHDSLGR